MSRVRTSVGLIEGASGKEYTFAMILNIGDAAAESIGVWRTKILDAILER